MPSCGVCPAPVVAARLCSSRCSGVRRRCDRPALTRAGIPQARRVRQRGRWAGSESALHVCGPTEGADGGLSRCTDISLVRSWPITPLEELAYVGIFVIMLHDFYVLREQAMATIKTIGSSGQITLGKEFAGRHVVVDQIEPGVWMIKLGQFIPDNERWLLDTSVQQEVDEAIAWAENNPPRSSDLDALAARLAP
jgi:hypothetical protein